MGITWAGAPSRQSMQMTGRRWLTARAARLLGHRVPDTIRDDEAVVITHKEA